MKSHVAKSANGKKMDNSNEFSISQASHKNSHHKKWAHLLTEMDLIFHMNIMIKKYLAL